MSVAEVGDSNHWQSAHIAVTAVSGDKALLEQLLSRCTSTIANSGDALVTRREVEMLAYSDDEPFGDEDLLATMPTGEDAQ